MACSCQGGGGTWEAIHADQTVSGPYATKPLAQAALIARGGKGFVRQRPAAATATR